MRVSIGRVGKPHGLDGSFYLEYPSLDQRWWQPGATFLAGGVVSAIVTYFVVPIAFSVVTGVIPQLRHAQPWIDPNTAQGPLFGAGGLSGKEWAQLGTAVLIWIVLPLVLGTWRMLRAEVK